MRSRPEPRNKPFVAEILMCLLWAAGMSAPAHAQTVTIGGQSVSVPGLQDWYKPGVGLYKDTKTTAVTTQGDSVAVDPSRGGCGSE